ncbi:hypothetical protein CBER1_06559 [Cercospora berteroae]|uniref:Pyrroline-5-carboxylate reductase n=1 Tax=Cercospora berteroae TaxID=357750 RepID=A0A2S6C3E0_9PEZI|nr:hypothetical protein CBER1_06559 [Cercospora berteroae]
MSGDLAPDWILKAALATQDTAHKSFVRMKPELRTQDEGLTMTVLGCGTMGTALLTGLLKSIKPQSQANNHDAAQAQNLPPRIPTKFNACVRTSTTAKKVHAALDKFDANLQVFENDNVTAVKEADVILLACPLDVIKDILCANGMAGALDDKLLISIVAGVSQRQILDIVFSSEDSLSLTSLTVLRAAPNLAAAVGEGMTIIARPESAPGDDNRDLVDSIFQSVGKILYLPEEKFDAGMALSCSGQAIYALVTESLAAGAIRSGVPREEAYTMAAQVLKGTAGLLQNGEHPALLRDELSVPGSCTSLALQVLEEGAVRGTISRAVTEAAHAAKKTKSIH